MIPHNWTNIENTPFIELEMKNGQKMYIHRAFKRVFENNPLVSEQEANNIRQNIQNTQKSQKTQKEKTLMEKIKESRLKRRQLKEKSKEQEPEPEVRLEEAPPQQQEEEQTQQQFSLMPAKIHRPGETKQKDVQMEEDLGKEDKIQIQIQEEETKVVEKKKVEKEIPIEEDPNAPSDSELDPNAESDDDLDPNAPSDPELDPNAPSDSELDPNAESSEEAASEAAPAPAAEPEEPTVMSMFEKKKLQIEKSKQTLAQYQEIAIEFLERRRITPETDFDEFDDLVKEKLKGRVAMSRKQKEDAYIAAVREFKSQKKDKIKQNFITYIKTFLPESEVSETSAFKDFKSHLKENSKSKISLCFL